MTSPEPDTVPPPGALPPLHVLVVDDDVVAIQALGHALRGVARVSFATRGRDALAQARALRPHLVLLDAELPDLDGLSVCRALRNDPATADLPIVMVTQHDSPAIEAEALQCGATDHLRKPVDPPTLRMRLLHHLRHPPGPRGLPRIPGPGTGERARVLIVDDDPVAVQLLRHLVGHLGDCHFALDGPSAVARARALQPDLVLLDLGLPGLDGVGVCRALRSAPDTRDTPIIVVSQETDPARTVLAWEAGADDLVAKPFDALVLQARVGRWLSSTPDRRVTTSLGRWHEAPGAAPVADGPGQPAWPGALPGAARTGGAGAARPLRGHGRGAQWLARQVDRWTAELQVALDALQVTTRPLAAAHPPLAQAAEALRRLRALASDVHDLRGIESGLLPMRIEPLDLATLLEEATAVLALSAPAAGTLLSYVPDPAVGQVLADRQRLQQVLQLALEALMTDAPAGASLSIRTVVDGDGPLSLLLTRSPGAPQAHAASLEPFAVDSPVWGLTLPLAASLLGAQGGGLGWSASPQALCLTLRLARPTGELAS